jgi:hypothetical protein
MLCFQQTARRIRTTRRTTRPSGLSPLRGLAPSRAPAPTLGSIAKNIRAPYTRKTKFAPATTDRCQAPHAITSAVQAPKGRAVEPKLLGRGGQSATVLNMPASAKAPEPSTRCTFLGHPTTTSGGTPSCDSDARFSRADCGHLVDGHALAVVPAGAGFKSPMAPLIEPCSRVFSQPERTAKNVGLSRAGNISSCASAGRR